MIRPHGKTYVCSACGWRYDEIDTVKTIGSMLNAFSDPEALRAIMEEQSRERVVAALAKHEAECPNIAAVSET